MVRDPDTRGDKIRTSVVRIGISELEKWSGNFLSVSAKSYMRGYRDIYPDVNAFHKLMIRLCDSLVRMKIVKIEFDEG